MDEIKESTKLKKLAHKYAIGELTLQEYRKQRNTIIDGCQGSLIETAGPSAPLSTREGGGCFVGEETTISSAAEPTEKALFSSHRLWGALLVVTALILCGFAVLAAAS